MKSLTRTIPAQEISICRRSMLIRHDRISYAYYEGVDGPQRRVTIPMDRLHGEITVGASRYGPQAVRTLLAAIADAIHDGDLRSADDHPTETADA